MGYYLSASIGYHEGDPLPDSTPVPKRPGPDHVLTGGVWTFVPPPATAEDVDNERDRRIDGGFAFNGQRFQSRASDRENIAGAATAALMAKLAGVSGNSLTWNPATNGQPFVWISSDNTLVPMSADAVLAFGQAALAHKASHVFAARALKDMSPIPTDYTDNKYWPTI